MVTMTAFAARIPQNTDVRIVLATASCLVSAGFLVNSLARRGWTSSIACMLFGLGAVQRAAPASPTPRWWCLLRLGRSSASRSSRSPVACL